MLLAKLHVMYRVIARSQLLGRCKPDRSKLGSLFRALPASRESPIYKVQTWYSFVKVEMEV